jgi:hypothetical protein
LLATIHSGNSTENKIIYPRMIPTDERVCSFVRLRKAEK